MPAGPWLAAHTDEQVPNLAGAWIRNNYMPGAESPSTGYLLLPLLTLEDNGSGTVLNEANMDLAKHKLGSSRLLRKVY